MIDIKFLIYFIGMISIIGMNIIICSRILKFILKSFRRKKFEFIGKPTTWAVVTGSTDGIGLEYAKQLYQKGYNLLLLSRNPQKLQKVKEEIQLKYGFKRCVRTLAIDFTQSSETIYQRIKQEFEEIQEIHILVNNVSICYPNESPELFTKIYDLDSFILQIINANILSCTRLTAMVLPSMEKTGRGAIINLSSICAKSPVPYLTIYNATKVYIDYFSRGLQEEYKNSNIFIQSVLPGYVSTKMSHNKKVSYFVPTPATFVKNALETVGYHDRSSVMLSHKAWGLEIDLQNIFYFLTGFDINKIYSSFKNKRIMRRIKNKNSLIIV